MTEPAPEVVELLSAAARDSVLALLRDPKVVDAFVEPYVRRMVMAGELVPRDRLQIGFGLELAPIGLGQAARALVDAVGATDMPELGNLAEAMQSLADVLDPPEAGEETVVAEVDAADVIEEPEEEPEEVLCEICKEPITLEQALLSKSRRWPPLCGKDFAAYKPRKKAS